jgi:hypothetical protein
MVVGWLAGWFFFDLLRDLGASIFGGQEELSLYFMQMKRSVSATVSLWISCDNKF